MNKSTQQVHRNLHLVTPSAKGDDVHALQLAVNLELTHRQLGWRTVKVDGVFGKRTLDACRFLGWVLGLNGKRLKAMRTHVAESVQQILRSPARRAGLDRTRERLRRGKVQKLRKAQTEGPAAAIAYIKRAAEDGVHEIGESNTGRLVDLWESFFGIHGEPWCGCLAGYAAKAIGGSKASTWFPYGPSIMADAAARRNGVYEVGFDQIRGGEVLVLWGGEHVVTAAGPPVGDSVPTGEGNTSPTDGNSQADGGAVAMKTRSRSDVSCVARVYG